MKNFEMKISDGALEVIQILEKAGATADLVGGCVRDGALGREAKDEDITTNFKPEEVIDLFKEKGYRVVPTGLQHGTVTVMVRDKGEFVGYEITTYRIDGESSDQRHPDSVTFVDNFKEDASRRDFTINAMGFNPSRGFTDYFGGMEDLENKIIRTVGDAKERFSEDALRMMRAVRFSAQLGFTIADDVKKAIKDLSKDINNVSKERIHDELVKILKSNNPALGLRTLHELGLLKEIMPAFEKCFDEKLGRQTNPWHLYNVAEHTLKAVENTPNDLATRMAALCHDLGKPIVRSTDEKGVDHFFKHPIKSAEIANSIMKELKFTTKERETVVQLVLLHDNRLQPERKKVQRFILKHPDVTPETFEKLMNLQKADCLAQNPELSLPCIDVINQVKTIFDEITAGPFRECDLAINGNDIMSITHTMKGEPISLRAEEIKIAKRLALEFVLEDANRNTKDELITFIKRKAKQIKATATVR